MNVRRQFSYYILFSEQKGGVALSKEDGKELPWNMEPSCIQNTSTGSGVTRRGMFSHSVYAFLT